LLGKAERGPAAILAIKKHQAVYLVEYRVSKAIGQARVVAFPDLGMEGRVSCA